MANVMTKSTLLKIIEKSAKQYMKADWGSCREEDLPLEYMFVAMLKYADPKTFSDGWPKQWLGDVKSEILELRSMMSELFISADRTEVRRKIGKPNPNAAIAREAVESKTQIKCQMAGENVMTATQYCKVMHQISSELLEQYTVRRQNSEELEQLIGLSRRRQRMKQKLMSQIIGQDEAVNMLVEGVISAEFLGKEKNNAKPRGIFVFAGPPGVGKTYLSELAAEELGLPVKRFDMSEYVNGEDSVSNLLGSDAVWKGAHKGELTSFVEECNKEKKGCFLIFDEIEKANTEVLHLFLQILDAGRLTDKNTGITVSFGDAYIVFTTNAGRSLYEDGKQPTKKIAKEEVIQALRTDVDPIHGKPFFPEAILSRFQSGHVVMFRHLEANELVSIGMKEMEKTAELFRKIYRLEVAIEPEIPFLLLLKMGGTCDVRAFRAESKRFIQEYLLKLADMVDEADIGSVLQQCRQIRFAVNSRSRRNLDKLLGMNEDRETVLLIAEDEEILNMLDSSSVEYLESYESYSFDSFEKALEELEKGMVYPSAIIAALPSKEKGGNHTEAVATKDPLQAKAYEKTRKFLLGMKQNLPEIPIYFLIDPLEHFEKNLVSCLIQYGGTGALVCDEEYEFLETLYEQVQKQAESRKLPDTAYRFARERKSLSYTVSLGREKEDLLIRLGDFETAVIVSGQDKENMVTGNEGPKVTFDDYIGGEAIKNEMKDFIRFLQNPRRYRVEGGEDPKGVLLYGPPGTGKTFLAKATANEANVPFFYENGSSFVSEYTGSGPVKMRELFAKARKYAPSIVFIDEIDTIARRRTGALAAKAEEETLNMLLSEMDGFDTDRRRPVFVMAATNYGIDPGSNMAIDPAIVRRFTRTVYVDLPNKEERLQYIKAKLSEHANQVSEPFLDTVAKRSVGMNYGNLNHVIDKAIRDAKVQGTAITELLLDDALETLLFGEKKAWGLEYSERTAWHEAGHAYINWRNGQTPEYITITARGDFGGYVMPATAEEKPMYTKKEILDEVKVCLAGRGAEILRYGWEGGLSTGASQDLKQAGKMITDYVCTYGMDDKLGLVYLPESGELPTEVRERIHELMEEMLKKVVDELTQEKDKLAEFVNQLMAKNKLMSYEINKILMEVE